MTNHQSPATRPVRTRFAPSPTGYMHIGGMRTALFNWLWARHNGGRFVLRIDDTDRQRNVEEALEPILQAFRWLELEWDEGPEVGGEFGPYLQSQRFDLYAQSAEKLLAEGKAFRDFDPPEVSRADREAAEKEKRNYLNVRRSLELSDAEVAQSLEEGKPYVVRFLVDRKRKLSIDDAIRGRVEWDCGQIPDPVILRGDGTPLYNFATVVDDGAMAISHVIRAEEHLSNTPVQVLMHEALGHELPTFAHIPFVAAPGTKEKLSKRDKAIEKYRRNPKFKRMFELADDRLPKLGLGSSDTLNPVMVAYYETLGYLPEAIFNALARLGWSLNDKTEILSRETVVENFTLERVIKGSAGLDPDKLDSYQLHWMQQRTLDEKITGCLPYLEKAGRLDQSPPAAPGGTETYVGRLITILEDRLKIFSDILDYDEYFVADDALQYDEKTFKKRLTNSPDSVALLKKYRDVLAEVEPFDIPTTEASLKGFVEAEGRKLGDVIHALRVAVTGKPKGPGMFDCLALLGKDRCLARVDRALSVSGEKG